MAAGIQRIVFLSSMAWHGHYDKYGFTKRIGDGIAGQSVVSVRCIGIETNVGNGARRQAVNRSPLFREFLHFRTMRCHSAVDLQHVAVDVGGVVL